MATIVVLDGSPLNPGDLSWAPLEELGDCTVYERTPPELILRRAGPAQILLTNKTPLCGATIAALPHLQYIGVLATGHDVVDGTAARERQIPVTNVPAYSTESVAQLVFGHLLNLTHHVGQHAAGVTSGTWSRSRDFCYWEFPLIELEGHIMGIVGFGRIGAATARIAQAFGMTVLAHDRSLPPAADRSVEFTSLDDLFRRSDVVTLHCPLTPETMALVNRERLRLMKPTAFLVNASRGPLVDEDALAEALNNGTLAGAGLDVLSSEPPPQENPLLSAPHCYITPHIGWATFAARKRLLARAAENIKAFLQGKPMNVVNA